MQKYRKSDQYYIDEYDRIIISELKEKEQSLKKAQEDLKDDSPEADVNKAIALSLNYSEHGIRARNKKDAINRWVERDEKKDKLLENYPPPPEPYCTDCNDYMILFDHEFINDDLLFIFSCGKGTKHNQVLHANGEPYIVPPKLCPYCNSEINTTVKKSKHKITATENCSKCTWSTKHIIDLKETSKEKIQPINEDDRKKYCTDFKGKKSFIEQLEALASITLDDEPNYNFSNIEKINLPQVEERLTKAIQSKGYIKLQFDQPKITGNVMVKFSVQDPTERMMEKSIKVLKKTIVDELFPTNWRLMSTEINYRLGFLDGQIKGADLREDLAKIANEIGQKKMQKPSS
jgi:hypothetical protein